MAQHLEAHQIKTATLRVDLIVVARIATFFGQMFQTFAIKTVERPDGEIDTVQ